MLPVLMLLPVDNPRNQLTLQDLLMHHPPAATCSDAAASSTMPLQFYVVGWCC